MNTTAASVPEALAEIMRPLISGEALPASDTPEFERISSLVAEHLRTGTAHDREQLGVRCLGLLIDACRARIAADEVLRDIGERP